MKKKILEYIYLYFKDFFDSKYPEKSISEEELEKVYLDHKSFFESLSVKDFIGYIPNDINEPALKAIENQGEIFEKWILWQSYYVNQKAINDTQNLLKYQGMMLYLKVLHVISKVNKKLKPSVEIRKETSVEVPYIESALEGIRDFKHGLQSNKNRNSKDAESKERKGNEGSKTKDS